MKSFARHTKLSNICGRVDYILNQDKQEEIVCHSEFVDFKEYANFEKSNQKTAIKNNEGREVVISIPNEWYELPRSELHEKCQYLAEVSCNKKTDMVWSCHWNKTRTNLHVHVVFSERTRLLDQEVKRYDRDIYLTNEGKIARRKADRAVNPKTGEILPPVHRKGEIKEGGFSAKDKTYKTKDWFEGTKERLQTEMEHMGVKFEEKGVLHEWHEGKGKYSYITKEKNEVIREVNRRISEAKQILPKEQHEKLDTHVKDEIRNKNIVVPNVQIEERKLKWKIEKFDNYSKAHEFIERTRDKFNSIVNRVKEKMKSLTQIKQEPQQQETHDKFIERMNREAERQRKEIERLQKDRLQQQEKRFDVNEHAQKMGEKLHGYMNARYKYSFATGYNIHELKQEISHEYREKLEKLDNYKSKYDDLTRQIERKSHDLNKLGAFDFKSKKALKNEISSLESDRKKCVEDMAEISRPHYAGLSQDYMKVNDFTHKSGYDETIRTFEYKANEEVKKEFAKEQLPQLEISKKFKSEFEELAKQVPDEYREVFQKAMTDFAMDFKKQVPEQFKKHGYHAWSDAYSHVINKMPLSKNQEKALELEKIKSKSYGIDR